MQNAILQSKAGICAEAGFRVERAAKTCRDGAAAIFWWL